MLVRLFGKNFRSLKDKFELSLVAADLKRQEDRNRGVIEAPIAGLPEPLKLLRTVAIYGANASGKSTVLTAANALHWLAIDSSERSTPDGEIPPYEPFLLDDETQGDPIELGCDVVFGESLLRYELAYGAEAIVREALTILDGNREEKLIDRQPSGETGGELIAHSEANRLYVREMQPNVTILSKLAHHGPHKGEESVQPYYKAIRDATRYADYSAAAMAMRIFGADRERFAVDAKYREWVMLHLIRAADLGIRDVHVRRESLKPYVALRSMMRAIEEELATAIEGESAMADTKSRLSGKTVAVSFIHEGKSNQLIDFSNESTGTRKLFNIAGDWWTLANESITLFADELGASLHPRLLDRLIRAFNDSPPDQVKSQLIFTTHETGLLESQDGLPPALRRDQVYFTKKTSEGASELYSLAEFKEGARPVHNIRKRYLSGLYGAIPSVERLSL